MSFEDELRQKTRSIASLEEEKIHEQRRTLESEAEQLCRKFSQSCVEAAEKGKKNFKISLTYPKTRSEDIKLLRDAVNAELRKIGFTDGSAKLFIVYETVRKKKYLIGKFICLGTKEHRTDNVLYYKLEVSTSWE